MGKYVFKLPDVGEGIVEGEIVDWKVKPGDAVTEDQPLDIQVRLEIEEGVEAAVKKMLKKKVGFYSLSPPLELHISSRNFLGLIPNLSKGAIWGKKRITVFKTKCMYDLEILRKGKAIPNNITERPLRELRKTYLSIISNFPKFNNKSMFKKSLRG